MARLCTLSSPLGDALLFSRMRVSERLSSLFVIQLEALSEKGDIKPGALLGKPLTIKVEHDDGTPRHYNGYASRVSLGGSRGRHFVYHLTLHPWLWFLSRTADCRIFQDLAVPKIIDAVLSDEPTKAVDDRLADAGKYQRWEYCVQYRETDFNFVSRLMEQEGIFYFFEHAEGAHKLVLVDSKERHAAIAGNAGIRFVSDAAAQTQQGDHVTSWTAVQEIQPGQYVLDDYDFKTPGNDLKVVRRAENTPEHAKSDYEIFDYPGDYDSHGEGESYVASRIEELHDQCAVFEGSGVLRQFHAGRKFKLIEHPRKDQNGEYLIVSVDYDYNDPPFESSDGEREGSSYHCSFTAIPLKQQFRPPRTTPRPIVQGIQTAVVAGPAGDEIHTDEYGRIKVKFHWDRAEEKNARSSCWLRVAFLAAGPRFGFVSIPRIGHEVVVDFLEGDPDRPLVTGVVYNGANLPPWALPANKTQSGLLTRSSLGGGAANANAIRFEDKIGAEQVWIHAEKNQDIEVENDETTTVGHDRTETVGNDETITIGVDRTESVGRNESVNIGSNRTHSVGASETWTVALQRTHTVGVNETISVGAAQEVTIGAMRSLTVGINQTTTIGSNQSVTVGSNQSEDIGGSQTSNIGKDRSVTIGGGDTLSVGKDGSASIGGAQSVSVGKARTTNIGEDDSLAVGKNLFISAADSITLKTGSASITMKKDGTIVINGKDITINGSGKIDIKASKDIVMKGSKILQN